VRLDVPLLHLTARGIRFDEYSRIWHERYGAMLSYSCRLLEYPETRQLESRVGRRTARFGFTHTAHAAQQYSLKSSWRSNSGRAS
jgi:hypothetical protein